jgi:hypothetical protein
MREAGNRQGRIGNRNAGATGCGQLPDQLGFENALCGRPLDGRGLLLTAANSRRPTPGRKDPGYTSSPPVQVLECAGKSRGVFTGFG